MEPPACPFAYASYPSTPLTLSGIPTTLFTHPTFSLHIPPEQPPRLLILLHPLFRKQEFHHGLSRRLIGDFYADKSRSPDDHLVVLTMDQRNHGARLTEKVRNLNWTRGNEHYALDLFATYTGTARDVSEVLDLLLGGGYMGALKGAVPYVGGVSLGGHCSWAAVLDDERIRGAGVVIGCGDYAALMNYRAEMQGWGGVVGQGIEHLLARFDLKTIMETKGIEEVKRKLLGKKILALEGLDDTEVPSSCSTEVYAKVKEAGVALKVRRFPGVEHIMNEEMCTVYSAWWREVWLVGGKSSAESKI